MPSIECHGVVIVADSVHCLLYAIERYGEIVSPLLCEYAGLEHLHCEALLQYDVDKVLTVTVYQQG